MRKSTKIEIQNIIRKEMMKQASAVVESLVYDYLKANNVDINKLDIQTEILTCSFQIYVAYSKSIFEVAHYHYDDCAWVITNQSRVYNYIAESFTRIFKLISNNITINERDW